MATLRNSSFVLAMAMGALPLFAVDWVYDTTQPGATNAQWSAAIGNSETPGFWQNSETGEYMRGSFSTDDTFHYGKPSDTVTTWLRLDSDISIGSLVFDLGTEWDASARLDGLTYTYGITINGDLVRSSTSKSAFLDAIRFVNITGDLSVLTNNLSIQAYSVEVGGNLTGTGQTFVSFVEGTSAKTIEEGIANPDMIVRGIVDAQKIQQKAIGRDTFVQIGGATGWASLCREAKRDAASAVSNNFTAYYIFTNTQDYSASGYFAEDINNTWGKESGKVGIIMDGTASQAFTGNNLKFQGGVIVKSGAIKFNFDQLTSNYEHNYTYTDADNRTKVTYFNSNLDGAQQTTFSHGDLEMSGGVFGADESNGYGAFRFTNIKYSGGTIKLRLDGADSFDSIDLTGYYAKIEVLESGAATSETWEAVEGGSVERLDGAGKITFDFGDNLAWIVDAEGDGVKVIAWDEGNQGSLTADDFSANLFTDGLGEKYAAVFAVNGDGLYVKYALVPEPATCAALAGLLALFAAYRRRVGK